MVEKQKRCSIYVWFCLMFAVIMVVSSTMPATQVYAAKSENKPVIKLYFEGGAERTELSKEELMPVGWSMYVGVQVKNTGTDISYQVFNTTCKSSDPSVAAVEYGRMIRTKQQDLL